MEYEQNRFLKKHGRKTKVFIGFSKLPDDIQSPDSPRSHTHVRSTLISPGAKCLASALAPTLDTISIMLLPIPHIGGVSSVADRLSKAEQGPQLDG